VKPQDSRKITRRNVFFLLYVWTEIVTTLVENDPVCRHVRVGAKLV
jgi:hypothetical protein